MDVECLPLYYLVHLNNFLYNDYYREHVTKYFYDKGFPMINTQMQPDVSGINISVDTIEDLKFVRKIFKDNKGYSCLNSKYVVKYLLGKGFSSENGKKHNPTNNEHAE